MQFLKGIVFEILPFPGDSCVGIHQFQGNKQAMIFLAKEGFPSAG
jgi:hypothetical protein